jgi:hypothetical protein
MTIRQRKQQLELAAILHSTHMDINAQEEGLLD